MSDELQTEGRTSYRQVRFRPPEGATEIVLVRHGETIAADPAEPFDMLDGQGDPELAPEGREHAARVGERLATEGGVSAVYITPLRRTLETARPLLDRLGMEPIVEPDLREIMLGEWEGGLYRKNVMEGHPVALEMLRTERWDAVPGAESNEAFAERLTAGINRIAAAHPNGRVVVVSHGGAIGMICSIATGARPFAFVAVDNGSVSRLVVAAGRWMVRGFNDVSHLA